MTGGLASMVVQLRELPPAEFPRLSGIGPFTGQIVPAEFSRAARIIVGETPTGQIVTIWGVLLVPHIEPLWIHPDHRHSPSLGRRLLTKLRSLLRDMRVTQAFAILLPDAPTGPDGADVVSRAEMARRLGLVPLEGQLMTIHLPQEDT